MKIVWKIAMDLDELDELRLLLESLPSKIDMKDSDEKAIINFINYLLNEVEKVLTND